MHPRWSPPRSRHPGSPGPGMAGGMSPRGRTQFVVGQLTESAAAPHSCSGDLPPTPLGVPPHDTGRIQR